MHFLTLIPPKWKLIFVQKLYINVISSFICSNQKVQSAQIPSTGEGLNKLWYIHTMEYPTAIKRNKLLIYVTIWITLQDAKNLKHVIMELQKLGLVTFKSLMEIEQSLFNIFIAYSAIYGPENYIRRNKQLNIWGQRGK